MVENTFFMSSKDLMGLDLLGHFFEGQIDSIKIEGRMRSILYAGMISKIYREAIDTFAKLGCLPIDQARVWHEELLRIPHREYMQGNLLSAADRGSVLDQGVFHRPHQDEFLGIVRKVEIDRYLLVEVRTAFQAGDRVELIPFEGRPVLLETQILTSALGVPIKKARVNQLVRFSFIPEAKLGQFLRKVGRGVP
jgi:putative protease